MPYRRRIVIERNGEHASLATFPPQILITLKKLPDALAELMELYVPNGKREEMGKIKKFEHI